MRGSEDRGRTHGKRRRTYPRWATPFEIFSAMPQCESYLKSGIGMNALRHFAQKQTDTEAAIAMQQAKQKLLSRVKKSA